MSNGSSKGQPLQITLHRPDLERFVNEKVKNGEYPNPDAVVEEALLRLQASPDDGSRATQELKAALNVGLEQLARGEGIELNGARQFDAFFDEVKRAGRERLDWGA